MYNNGREVPKIDRTYTGDCCATIAELWIFASSPTDIGCKNIPCNMSSLSSSHSLIAQSPLVRTWLPSCSTRHPSTDPVIHGRSEVSDRKQPRQSPQGLHPRCGWVKASQTPRAFCSSDQANRTYQRLRSSGRRRLNHLLFGTRLRCWDRPSCRDTRAYSQ